MSLQDYIVGTFKNIGEDGYSSKIDDIMDKIDEEYNKGEDNAGLVEGLINASDAVDIIEGNANTLRTMLEKKIEKIDTLS